MPLFSYMSIDRGGSLTQGSMEARDVSDVIGQLQRQGQIVVRAGPAGRSGLFGGAIRLELKRGLPRQKVADLTRELAIMLAAGQNLDRALHFLIDSTRNQRMLAVLQDLRNTLRNGSSFAAALNRHPDSFSRLYIGMVQAGEAGGSLEDTLSRLAEMLERDRALSATIISAMIYPALLTVAAIGSITLLLTEVLPQFVPLFEQSGAQLPQSTQLLIAAGDLVSRDGLSWLIGIGILLFAGRMALQRAGARLVADRMILRLPVFGALTREVMASRLTRTLGTLLINGVPLIGALTIAGPVVGNRAGIAAVQEAASAARGGGGLVAPLERTGVFPLRTIHMLRLGEATGQLGPMALRVAAIHETTVQRGLQRVVALLVPVITIIMGAAIAGIISSLLLAMLSLNDLAG